MSGLTIVGALLDDHAPFGVAVPASNFDLWKLPQGAGLPNVVGTRVSRVEKQFLSAQTMRLVTERIQLTVRANSGEEREAITATIRDACREKTGTIAGFTNVAALLAGDGPDFEVEDEAIYIGSTDVRVTFVEPA